MKKIKGLSTLIKKLKLECHEGTKHTRYTLFVDGTRIGEFGVTRSSKKNDLPKYVNDQLKIDKNIFENVLACFASMDEIKAHFQDKGII